MKLPKLDGDDAGVRAEGEDDFSCRTSSWTKMGESSDADIIPNPAENSSHTAWLAFGRKAPGHVELTLLHG